MPGDKPVARGPPAGGRHRHSNIHVNMEEEREHLRSHVEEEYMDKDELMNDENLLMQYFKRHDTDGNNKLDGLELVKALSRMNEEDDHHHEGEGEIGGDEIPAFSVSEVIPIIDSLLEQDDLDTDGYITWPEFLSRQKQHKNNK